VVRVARGVGWTLVAAGAVVLLYVVYLLWFTGLGTSQAQRDLGDRFESMIEAPPRADGGADVATDTDDAAANDEPPEVGDAYAAMWFERDGERIVSDDVLYVVEGTALDDLRAGPGHYVDSAEPGGEGNLGIAGHRTTYGAPFGQLDQLADGDTIHVVDRQGTEWIYEYREQRVVHPTEVWVVEEEDPIELDGPTITLTTCHPRFSAAQRLVAWGELVGPADA
jgi:sortase A